jgi:hypothetical protein
VIYLAFDRLATRWEAWRVRRFGSVPDAADVEPE